MNLELVANRMHAALADSAEWAELADNFAIWPDEAGQLYWQWIDFDDIADQPAAELVMDRAFALAVGDTAALLDQADSAPAEAAGGEWLNVGGAL